MILENVRLIDSTNPVDIAIRDGKIHTVGEAKELKGTRINCKGALALPGLINSHDHLHFNCFPPLALNTYRSYVEWGADIHNRYKNEINAVLTIPLQLRISWGLYKNLLAGVTTVVHHGKTIRLRNPVISVHQKCQNLHSVRLEKYWKWKLNNPLLQHKACVMHVGEGIDKQSTEEIDQLIKSNMLGRRLIGVHGVAMQPRQASEFSGLIWCPATNRFLLEKHADVSRLKELTQIAFGTDSTLTGRWNMWDHLRFARSLSMLNDEELFGLVTTAAAQLWTLHKGLIEPGFDADIVLVPAAAGSGWNGLYELDPADILLVMHAGSIRLFDEGFFRGERATLKDRQIFSRISVGESIKEVSGDLSGLMHAIRHFHQGAHLPTEVKPLDN